MQAEFIPAQQDLIKVTCLVKGGLKKTLSKTLSCPIKLKVLAISLNFLLGLQPGGVMLCYILVLMQSNYSHFHLSLRALTLLLLSFPPFSFQSAFLPSMPPDGFKKSTKEREGREKLV